MVVQHAELCAELCLNASAPCMQVRVWVPAAVMRRAQAMMVQGTGPGSSGLTLTVNSNFQESSVPLQVSTTDSLAFILAITLCIYSSKPMISCSSAVQPGQGQGFAHLVCDQTPLHPCYLAKTRDQKCKLLWCRSQHDHVMCTCRYMRGDQLWCQTCKEPLVRSWSGCGRSLMGMICRAIARKSLERC